jgi:hypothetical protein
MTQRCSAPGLKLNVPHVKLLRQRWLSFCGSTQHLQQQCAKVLHISSCGMDAQCLLFCPSAGIQLLNNVSELCCSEHGRHLAILQRCGEAHLVGGDLQSNTNDSTCLVIVMASLQFSWKSWVCMCVILSSTVAQQIQTIASQKLYAVISAINTSKFSRTSPAARLLWQEGRQMQCQPHALLQVRASRPARSS